MSSPVVLLDQDLLYGLIQEQRQLVQQLKREASVQRVPVSQALEHLRDWVLGQSAQEQDGTTS